MSYPLTHSHLVLARLAKLLPASLPPTQHWIILEGEKTLCRHDTDRELAFRQESNFAYLTGCDVPGSALILKATLDGQTVSDLNATLYLPDVDPDEIMWCGEPVTPDELKAKLTLTAIVPGWTPQSLFPPQHPTLPTMVHHLPWHKPASIARINGPRVTSEYLLTALHQARRNKTEKEVEVMRRASEITADAHLALMKAIGSGEVTDENAAEALFVGVCRKAGSKHQAYTPIMGAGTAASVLHYISNEKPFPSGEKGGLILVDAGAEIDCYAADVTRCCPIGNGGRFTKECKDIYETVLAMQLAAFDIIRPGTDWEQVQLLMHDVLIRQLLKLGLFVPGDVEGTEDEVVKAILDSGLSTAFYPHGVGHLLGLDVHDVGGLPEGKSQNPLLKYLRLRVPLEEGFVVTVEPGLYFNTHLFAPFRNSPFVNHDLLEKYWYVGGVRIEDNLLIVKDGFENLTPARLPKTVEEIEAVTAARG